MTLLTAILLSVTMGLLGTLLIERAAAAAAEHRAASQPAALQPQRRNAQRSCLMHLSCSSSYYGDHSP